MDFFEDDELCLEATLDPEILEVLENAEDIAADSPQEYGLHEASLF